MQWKNKSTNAEIIFIAVILIIYFIQSVTELIRDFKFGLDIECQYKNKIKITRLYVNI